MIDWFIVQDDLNIVIPKSTSEALSKIFERGWGNGYVALPPGHPWYEIEYTNIPAGACGELTYSDYGRHLYSCPRNLFKHWVIGFDTAHAWNTKENSTEDFVRRETIKLYAQAFLVIPNFEKMKEMKE